MTYTIAIIGFGGMAGWHLTGIIPKAGGFKVKGAYDIRPEACETIVSKGLKLYSSPEEIYSDPEIDLVLIATPNDSHKPYAIASLQAGKNVVCEKPVAMNTGELEEIYVAAEKAGKFFTVHQNRRWDTDFLMIKKILDEKILSKPYRIESRVQGSRQLLHGWRGHKVNGGGMIYDWGAHLVDQMLLVIPSKLVMVDAHTHNTYTKEVDDNFICMFRFENGLTYLMEVSNNCFITQPRWHMCCEDGTVVIEDWGQSGKIVKLKEDEAFEWSEEIVYTKAGPTRAMAPRPKDTTIELPLPTVTGESPDYFKNIHAVLEGKEDLVVTKDQALRLMKVIDLMFESAESGKGVSCYL